MTRYVTIVLTVTRKGDRNEGKIEDQNVSSAYVGQVESSFEGFGCKKERATSSVDHGSRSREDESRR